MSNLKLTLAVWGLFIVTVVLSVGVTADSDVAEDSLAWYAMRRAEVGVLDAMNKAKVEQTGRIIKFEADDEEGRLVYKFDLLDNKSDKEHEIKIDARSGKVLSHEREAAEKWLKKPLGQEMLKATPNMSEAFEIANRFEPGMIIKAKFKVTMGVAAYIVDVISEDTVIQVLFDAKTGERLPMLRSR